MHDTCHDVFVAQMTTTRERFEPLLKSACALYSKSNPIGIRLQKIYDELCAVEAMCLDGASNKGFNNKPPGDEQPTFRQKSA